MEPKALQLPDLQARVSGGQTTKPNVFQRAQPKTQQGHHLPQATCSRTHGPLGPLGNPISQMMDFGVSWNPSQSMPESCRLQMFVLRTKFGMAGPMFGNRCF